MKHRRTIIIGDVHGCLDELKRLLRKVDYRFSDRLVMVGDLVAKGPDSQGVIHLLRDLSAQSVLGNHDDHLLRWRRGGEVKKQHEKIAKTLKKADWKWLEDLPLLLQFPDINAVVVHGGLMPGVRLKKQKREHMLNLRSIDEEGWPSTRVSGGDPWASFWRGPEHVHFGHDALRGFQKWPHATGLDTGCVYGRELTAKVYPGGHIVSVDAKKKYAGFD
jgi:hypothetical protein